MPLTNVILEENHRHPRVRRRQEIQKLTIQLSQAANDIDNEKVFPCQLSIYRRDLGLKPEATKMPVVSFQHLEEYFMYVKTCNDKDSEYVM